MSKMNRRDFVKASAAAGVGYWVAGGVSLAQSKSANGKLNIASVGAGGRASADINGCSSENIVALCDVDEGRASATFNKYDKAAKYKDFRVMLEKEQKNIDAVIVATPDHIHAPAAVMAMKLGKHVYVEKPLTHSVYEARIMRETAKKMGVATQMGNQGTASGGLRTGVEIVQAGGIGDVTEAHIWSNRPVWPQGERALREREKWAGNPAPAALDWDLWLGPAPKVDYNRIYVPFNWRGWYDWGTGALGDMACHTMNLPFWALKLEYPQSFMATVKAIYEDTYPEWSHIVFDFPARGGMPPVKLSWYDGTRAGLPTEVRRYEQVLREQGVTKIPNSGSLMIGSKGMLYSPGDYGSSIELLPREAFSGYRKPDPTLPRSPGHHREWIEACKGGPAAASNFDYAAFLTEIILLGNLAMRLPDRKIEWDGPNMKSPNVPEATALTRRDYRDGYEL